jgi:hypothetical protein
MQKLLRNFNKNTSLFKKAKITDILGIFNIVVII